MATLGKIEPKTIEAEQAIVEKAEQPHQQPYDSEVNINSKTPMLFGLFMFLALFVGGGYWLYAVNLSGAVIATGTVAVQGKPKTIQHLDGGIVAEINIADGIKVKKNDVLIKLDETLLNANLQIYKSRLREATARRARLITERDGETEITWDDSILELLDIEDDKAIKEGHQKLFEARRTSMNGQVEQLRQQGEQFKNQIKGVNALKASKERQQIMLTEELANISNLKDQGLVTNNQVMGLERQKEELSGQLGEHDAELARIENSINESEIQILQIERELRQSVLTELREVEQEVNDMTQQLQSTVEQLKRVEIKAPVDGVIHELSVFTIGGVIGPGAPIMQIIPQDDNFVVEANVEPQFIDELYPGQEAAVRFSAFNQNSTPELFGEVAGISANVVVDEQTGAAFYKVRVGVSDEELARLNGLQLIPGMPVEAFIKTRERTALNYLVKPLLDQVNRAFREE